MAITRSPQRASLIQPPVLMYRRDVAIVLCAESCSFSRATQAAGGGDPDARRIATASPTINWIERLSGVARAFS
jgi:hypothetical protein